MLNSKVKKVKKSDYYRALVTETIPYETPLIFANDGFYFRCVARGGVTGVSRYLYSKLVEGDGRKKQFTIPYHYKIRKNSIDFRRLSVVHPISQMQMMRFYERNEKLIIHYCSKSKFSIRCPQKVAGVFYYKNSWENVSKYKRGSVNEVVSDSVIKHSSSFYSYAGFDRLYKFFNSRLFLSLEKKFSVLLTMDVSKCFDSIYTHSISWAAKEKQYVKSKLGVSSTFGQSFDSLMQAANYNETNGILIGPEISRIFAEVIFQDIDCSAQTRLATASAPLMYGVNYSVKRYVDDVFIFASRDSVTKRVYKVYADCLASYNLHVNSSKSVEYLRPFFTAKSRVIRDVNVKVNEFCDRFLSSEDGDAILKPKEIYRRENLIRSFIDAIKSTCSSNSVDYDDVSSYLISAFFERVKRVINVQSPMRDNEMQNQYRDVLLVFLEVMFFFYSVSPSVSSSYKICASTILMSRFSEQMLGPYEHTVKQRIFELALELLLSEIGEVSVEINNFILLEELNVILAISDLGEEYLLPSVLVGRIFSRDRSYFYLVACLFYIKNFKQYDDVRRSVVDEINVRLSDLSDLQVNTEKVSLFLDSVTCPYIDVKVKKKWLRDFYKVTGGGMLTNAQADEYFGMVDANEFWFVNWKEIDLLNALEKKELKQVY